MPTFDFFGGSTQTTNNNANIPNGGMYNNNDNMFNFFGNQTQQTSNNVSNGMNVNDNFNNLTKQLNNLNMNNSNNNQNMNKNNGNTFDFFSQSQPQQQPQQQFNYMNNNNNQNNFNMQQNQNNAFGGFTFNVNPNQNQSQNNNNNQNNEDVFEEVKENGATQPKVEAKGGLSSLLDTKLVNLDLLGPKKTAGNNNAFNNYW